jgi:UDP-2,4-diacetamido-2,4,6-trideoxy-beta-L-altropyranose hydrolase
MKIIVRADAGIEIGSGHVMRCLMFANRLRQRGADISFVCNDMNGNLNRLIERNGYVVRSLFSNDVKCMIGILQNENTTVDWLLVDHYSLDACWEKQLRPYVGKIMVFDDLANRPHDSDVLLDANYTKNIKNRYDGLLPVSCERFLGPKYALLREEFYAEKNKLLKRDGVVRRIFVSFGGADLTNETAKVLKAIKAWNRPEIVIDVVIGALNPHKKEVERFAKELPKHSLYYQVDNMAQLMSEADLSIGGGGTTTWERCFLGLPSIVLVLAQNQEESTAAVAEAGAIWSLGNCSFVSEIEIIASLERAVRNPALVRNMRVNALKLMGDKKNDHIDEILDLIMEEKKIGAH